MISFDLDASATKHSGQFSKSNEAQLKKPNDEDMIFSRIDKWINKWLVAKSKIES